MTLWDFLFRTVWHPEWVQEHADGSWKKTADCKALKDFHEEEIYSLFIFKKCKSIFNSLECLFYCASNSSAIPGKISCQSGKTSVELIYTGILTSIYGKNMWES